MAGWSVFGGALVCWFLWLYTHWHLAESYRNQAKNLRNEYANWGVSPWTGRAVEVNQVADVSWQTDIIWSISDS